MEARSGHTQQEITDRRSTRKTNHTRKRTKADAIIQTVQSAARGATALCVRCHSHIRVMGDDTQINMDCEQSEESTGARLVFVRNYLS